MTKVEVACNDQHRVRGWCVGVGKNISLFVVVKYCTREGRKE